VLISNNILRIKGGVCKEYYCAIKPRSETISCKGRSASEAGREKADDAIGFCGLGGDAIRCARGGIIWARRLSAPRPAGRDQLSARVYCKKI